MERVDLEEVAIIRFAPGLETRILILIKVRLAKTSQPAEGLGVHQ